MKTFAITTVCMLALVASAMSGDQAAVEYIGVVHEYTDEVHVSLLKGGESGTTLLTIHELECDKPRIEIPETLSSIVREGNFADPDPLMPRLTPRKALVRIQESYYALYPSDDLIYAVRMRHFGGGVYRASGNMPILGAFASFRDEKL